MARLSIDGSTKPTAILHDDLEISKPVFLKSYKAAEKSREKRLLAIVRNPDEGAVHDARTAVRRLEAHIEVLPGRIRRSPKMDKLQKKHDKMMKLTAAVRDLDVIRQNVVRQDASVEERLLSRIDEDRMDSLERAVAAAAAGRRAALSPGHGDGEPAWHGARRTGHPQVEHAALLTGHGRRANWPDWW